MPQQVRRRKQVDINYQANSKVSERLSRGMVYRELYLYLTCQPDLLLTENVQALIEQGDEWGVVKRIDIIANNTQVIRSISGNQLWWLNHFMYGVQPPLSVALGNGVADPAVCTSLVLPFWMPRSIRPLDTALDARELSDLKIEVTWGDSTDIAASAAPGFLQEPVLEVHSLECFNINRTFSQWRSYDIVHTVTAANASFQVILPVGPMYRGFMINTTHQAAGVKNPTDTPLCLDNFKIKSGTTVYADIPDYILQQVDGWTRASINRPYDADVPGAVDPGYYDTLRRGDVCNNVNGWYFYDHVTDGYLSEAIDTLGFSEFELELEVAVAGLTGPVEIHIMPQQIIPVRGR
jgi:hypothetical protein